MSTQIVQTDGNPPKLKVSTSEETIQQTRNSNNSTPQSTSDSDDVNNNSKCNNNELAVRNFERFRKNSAEDATSPTPPPPGDSIAEYCTESLYSYSFTPLSRVNKAARIKKQILNRGMDYMQRIRWRTGERDTGRRFSQPDIGVLDQTHDWVVDNPTTTKRIYRENGLPLTSAPPVSHSSILPTQSSPMPKVNPTQDEVDEGFNLGRRQTLEVFNNLLPHVYEKNAHQLPCSAQYTRALHAPSRFLPQNQAILTTDDEATILLFNDIASLCFGIDKQYIGKSVLDTLEEPFKQQISGILKRRRHDHPDQQGKGGLVLVCGIVVPIHKINNCDSGAAASLWLKEKITEEGKRIYIWIFEEIYETSVSTVLDDQGRIVEVIGTPKDLFGYASEEVVGKSISELIPALSNNLLTVDKLKFYGGRSANGIYFPTMINMSTNRLKIMSLPSIAGLITVHSTGKIQSINPVPAKYLFGYSTDALVNKFDIDQIIPKFSDVVDGLKRFNLLQLASTVNNHACRWVISELCTSETRDPSLKMLERQPSVTANGKFLPIIHAVHRDGSQFEIQLQLRLIESDKEDLISIWVTYDRIYAMKRAKRMAALLQQEQEIVPPIKSDDTHTDIPKESAIISSSNPALSLHGEQDALPIPSHIKKRPAIKPYGISSFGSVDQKKALFPSGMDDNKPSTVPLQDSKKPPHPMDDYVIIGTLGEGAYGAAKLAYRKDDMTQTKVVIKFIAKSRIIVDSWIRDRQLGMIPLEIHILKKLREYPQENCSALETYAEDEDTYFVVTKQYGVSSMDLFDYIELNEHIEENEVRNIFRQVCLAVNHCQELRIVHRDIKDENILLDENGHVHLIDFGSAAYFRKGRAFDTFGGTLDYCAPEILKGMPYEGPPQDIWSLGTLLYTLIYRENPFYNVDEIMEHDLRIPFILSEGSLDLIKKMLNRDVEKRYTIHQVLEHPWLKSN